MPSRSRAARLDARRPGESDGDQRGLSWRVRAGRRHSRKKRPSLACSARTSRRRIHFRERRGSWCEAQIARRQRLFGRSYVLRCFLRFERDSPCSSASDAAGLLWLEQHARTASLILLPKSNGGPQWPAPFVTYRCSAYVSSMSFVQHRDLLATKYVTPRQLDGAAPTDWPRSRPRISPPDPYRCPTRPYRPACSTDRRKVGHGALCGVVAGV